MSKAYPSNLTRAQYEFLSDMIPDPKPGGRKREVDMWSVLNGIFYILLEGVRWRASKGTFRLGKLYTHISETGVRTGHGCTSMIVCESGRELRLSAIQVHHSRSSIVKALRVLQW